jgi:molybdate transport system ATP-binding protein
VVDRAVTVEATIRVTRGNFTLDAELTVADGEVLAVLGPNGAGKTTLLHALVGLVPIDDGRIVLADMVVDDPSAGCFVEPEQRPVGVVFQDYLLFPHLDVLDNIAFGLREHGMRTHAARDRAAGLLAGAGLAELAGAKPATLSGGQSQRVALLRAVAPEPSLLLLDEPLAALDVQRRLEVRRALVPTLAGFGGARIIVTHDPVDALTLADRLLVLEAGRVTQVGRPDDIVAHPRTEYVAELVGTNLYRGVARGDEVVLDGGGRLATATHLEADVLAVVPPHSVVVHISPPAGSARNVVAGTVSSLDRLGSRVRVRIEGALPIVAEITPAAVAALGLREGTHVWAAVKATEIEVYPA